MLTDLWDVLEAHPIVGLLPLILNYDSFAQTVENLFQLAFLVSCSVSQRVGMLKAVLAGQAPAHTATSCLAKLTGGSAASALQRLLRCNDSSGCQLPRMWCPVTAFVIRRETCVCLSAILYPLCHLQHGRCGTPK